MRIIALFLFLVSSSSIIMADSLAHVVKETGVSGGIIVHAGATDPEETASLKVNDRFIVQGLVKADGRIDQIRASAAAQPDYGTVSFREYSGDTLPYDDRSINLLIVEDDSLPEKEITRVLVPMGAAVKRKGKPDGIWQSLGKDSELMVYRKPRAASLDDWTHYLHGPDNNAVSQDKGIGIPRSMKWVAAPRWGRSHEEMASMSALVTSGGRMFYIVDEAPNATIRYIGSWVLVGRDAFNGVKLWEKSIPLWSDHLRHFRAGPVHLPRRLVAVGDKVYVTLGLTAPVTVLSAEDGKVLQTYTGTDRTEEITVLGDTVYLVVGTSEISRVGGGLFTRNEPEATDFRYITAIDEKTGRIKWKKDFSKDAYLLPLSMTVRDGKVFYQSSDGVGCLDAVTGKDLWMTERNTLGRRMSFSTSTMVAADKVLLCADRETGSGDTAPSEGEVKWGVHGWGENGYSRKGKSVIKAYSVKDGRELWSAPCEEGYNSPVDVFVINNLVYVGNGFQGRDLLTGKVVKELNTKGDPVGMVHDRCHRNKATVKYIYTCHAGIEIIDVDKGWYSNNSWIRGTCQYGIMPANGFIYVPPDACACFPLVRTPGMIAMTARRDMVSAKSGKKTVVVKGPAYGKIKAEQAGPEDWPTYRAGAARPGVSSTRLPVAVREKWKTAIGGRLTQPVAVAGKVFLASVDRHTVYAVDMKSGKIEWQFTAGGRVDSAPTYHNGSLLFGCADGWVYCLRAEDGVTSWKYRAAPSDLQITAYGQLESAWPVHGSVLVQNGRVYCSAGRSSYIDGGIILRALDPATGAEIASKVVYDIDPETDRQKIVERRGSFNMEGTTSDVLSGDGNTIYLKKLRFDADLNEMKETGAHLFSVTGFLGEEWFIRSYWLHGTDVGAGWGRWANASGRVPFGRILCIDDTGVYGYGRVKIAGGATGHRADAYHLFKQNMKTPSAQKPAAEVKQGKKKKRGRSGTQTSVENIWTNGDSLTVRAMALASDKLIVAGPKDAGVKNDKLLSFQNDDEARSYYSGRKGAFLRLYGAKDGAMMSELKLAHKPVFDGMSAANGCILISLDNGELACFSGK